MDSPAIIKDGNSLCSIPMENQFKPQKLKGWFWLIALILLGLAPGAPPPAAQANLSLEVQAGFDAFYKTNTWTPIQVIIANQGPDLKAQLRLLDDHAGFGASNVLYRYPVDLPGQSRQQFTLYLPLRGQRQLTVELVDHEDNLLLSAKSSLAAVEEDGVLAGVVAGDPSLLNGLTRFKTPDGARVAVAHLDLDDLPPTPQAWTGLDLLIFNDVDTSHLTPAQQDALQSWVRFGGRLLVGGGPNAAQTIAGLASLLPFSTLVVQTLPHPLTALQMFASTPLEDRGPYLVAAPSNTTGTIIAGRRELPLIIRTERGLGQIYYLALDLGLAPLDRLAGDPLFIPRLVGAFQPQQPSLVQQASKDQMRSSLALIPDQGLPAPATVALYLGLYILVIGPLNYFVLNRLKHREWAWFSIPLIILLFSGYSYFSSFRLRGGRPLVRQITLLQAEMGSPLAVAASFIGIYSPGRTDYTLRFDGPVLIESLPDAYGLSNQLTVTTQDSTLVENLRGDIGGLPGLIAYSQTRPPQITAILNYSRSNSRIYGSITNQTGQPIDHALLAIDDQVANLGSLAVGETQVDRFTTVRYDYSNFYQDLNPGYNAFIPDVKPADYRAAMRLASRDMVVRALFDPDNDNGVHHQPGQMYLLAWQEGTPVEVSLTSHKGDQMNETLLLVHVSFTVR